MKLIIYIYIIVFCSTILHAQEDNNWVFGRELGISFNTEPPKIFKTVADVWMFSVCKSNYKGELLFYSNNGYIYNFKNIGLWPVKYDGYSNRALALALPGAQSIFYIFYGSNDSGLVCTVIDMAANNGTGSILEHKLLYKGKFRGITATRYEDGYWIVAKKNVDSTISFVFNTNGIGAMVESKLGVSQPRKDSYAAHNSMKFSHNGSLLAETISLYNDLADKNTMSHTLNLYQFDKKNGTASYLNTIKRSDSISQGSRNLYESILYNDIVFSPNDSLLYFSYVYTGKYYLLQYQLYSPDIAASSIEIANVGTALQIAPNGKLYIIDSNICKYLSEIKYPDKIGKACGFTPSTVEITKKDRVVAGFAFPTIVDYKHYGFRYIYKKCSKDVQFINESDTSHWKKFTWYFCDAANKPIDSTNLFSPVYSFPKSGRYIIKLKASTKYDYSVWRTDTVRFIKPPTAHYTTDINQKGCQWVGYQFTNLSTADTIHPIFGESYIWDFGDGTTDTAKNPLHIFTKPGNYNVKLIYSNGFCSDTFTQQQTVEILSAPKPGFTVNDTLGCAPFKLKINYVPGANVQQVTYSFGDGNLSNEAAPEHIFRKPGIYWVIQKLLGTTGCFTTDSVKIRVRNGIAANEKPKMLNASFINNSTIQISWRKHSLAAHYDLYKKSSAQAQYKLYKARLPAGQAFLADTIYADDVEITSTLPVTYAIVAVDSCGKQSALSLAGQPVILSAQNIENKYILLQWSAYEKWQNGVQEYVLEYKQPDESFSQINSTAFLQLEDDVNYNDGSILTQCYRLKAIENKGNNQHSYSNIACADHLPQIYIPNAFSPNDDNLNDSFKIFTIGIREYKISVFNRWGEVVFTGEKGLGWDGKFMGLPVSEGAYTYRLQARTRKGDRINLTGTINILR